MYHLLVQNSDHSFVVYEQHESLERAEEQWKWFSDLCEALCNERPIGSITRNYHEILKQKPADFEINRRTVWSRRIPTRGK